MTESSEPSPTVDSPGAGLLRVAELAPDLAFCGRGWCMPSGVKE